MGTVTVRPDGTDLNDGTITGAALANLALADDSDASYVSLDDLDALDLAFAEPTIPAGAVIRYSSVRARMAKIGSNNKQLYIVLQRDAGETGKPNTSRVITSTSIITYSLMFVYSDAVADDIEVSFQVTDNHGNDLRIYEAFVDFVYVAQPVVDPTYPTGTITNDTNPTVTWDTGAVDGDGGPPTHYQVKIFTDAQYGIGGFDPETSPSTYDSGEIEGADTSLALPQALVDDTYRVYVKIAQTVNDEKHWSGWAFNGFVMDVDAPAAPTINATGSDVDGSINLAVTTGAAPASDFYEVERSIDGGATWESVFRSEDNEGVDAPYFLPNSGTGLAVSDYEAPNGVVTTYRARGVHDYDPGLAKSAWSATDADSWESNEWWVKDIADPSNNFSGVGRSQPGRTRASRVGAHAILGRKFPIAIRDKHQGSEGEFVFRLSSEAERQAFDDFLDDLSGPVLLQGTPGAMWQDKWVVVGDMAEDRALDSSWFVHTFTGFHWIEVERPEDLLTAS